MAMVILASRHREIRVFFFFFLVSHVGPELLHSSTKGENFVGLTQRPSLILILAGTFLGGVITVGT